MKIAMRIKKLLMKTIFRDFVILLTAPVDTAAIQSIKEEAAKIGPERNFEGFVFGNIIVSSKSS